MKFICISDTHNKHKDLNDKFRGYLEQVIKIGRKLSKIKPVEVKSSRTTQMIDWAKNGLGLYRKDHRPKRVNEKIGMFKETVRGMLGNIADLPPGELKDTVGKTTSYFIKDFQDSLGQAMYDYGKGKKERQSRQAGEARIDKLNERVKQMNEYLEEWKNQSKEVAKIQAKIKLASSPNDAISHTEQLVADKLVKDLESGYKQALNNLKDHYDAYKQVENRGLDVKRDLQSLRAVHERIQEVSKRFDNAHESIKNAYSQLRILSGCSDEWRQVNDVRAQLEAAHSDATEENTRIQQLSDKILNGAQNAFDEAQDDPRKLTNVYDKLKETGHQLRILRDHPDKWRQANDIPPQLQEAYKEKWKQVQEYEKEFSKHATYVLEDDKRNSLLNSFKQAFDKAEKAYKELTKSYEQRRDLSSPKKRFEEACKELEELSKKAYNARQDHISKPNND